MCIARHSISPNPYEFVIQILNPVRGICYPIILLVLRGYGGDKCVHWEREKGTSLGLHNCGSLLVHSTYFTIHNLIVDTQNGQTGLRQSIGTNRCTLHTRFQRCEITPFTSVKIQNTVSVLSKRVAYSTPKTPKIGPYRTNRSQMYFTNPSRRAEIALFDIGQRQTCVLGLSRRVRAVSIKYPKLICIVKLDPYCTYPS